MTDLSAAGMKEYLHKFWGYDSFLPLQEEIMSAILQGESTLNVLPTGGGKSICFQLPAIMSYGMAVVISPLISLMKDQVDTLKACGIPAGYLNSSLTPIQQQILIEEIISRKIKILYISPERLQIESTKNILSSVSLSFFVIDEAHCISQWGHDFRPEYRKLKVIREEFGDLPVHCFTATATVEVQRDIFNQLYSQAPKMFFGSIDRPNLTYRVRLRENILSQITDTLDKHKGQPGIIYCLRRKDVEKISEKLKQKGYNCLAYHAGLTDQKRNDSQTKFSREEIDIIVATIAFGMGIDRSNIRFIIHAAMPRSIEHYQQETGRAGRDGLKSFCYLFYSPADFQLMRFMSKNSSNSEIMINKLKEIYNFCSQPQCRHKFLANYFGQDYFHSDCRACDLCLGEIEFMDDSKDIVSKIIFCLEELKRISGCSFGADHIAHLLKGSESERIKKHNHTSLESFAAMEDKSMTFIRSILEQLISQNILHRDIKFSVLKLTTEAGMVIRGERNIRLAKPLVLAPKKKTAKSRPKLDNKDCYDLFSLLRKKRAYLAQRDKVPAYIIFGDRTLEEITKFKPRSLSDLALIFGVGEHKLRVYGQEFISIVNDYCKGGGSDV
ncbi:MAG: RecQ family ATP-dependent DNA helicase [Candidatus Omnitrophica bacterium]|nr:RecQ family ATP-dependent DNA helicase [Candidatus Omnitrophota bacterium]